MYPWLHESENVIEKKSKKNTSVALIKSEKIVMKTNNGFEFININDIIRCRAEGKNTICYLTNDRVLRIASLLKKIEDELAAFNFLRIHHTHLVNVNYVFKYVRIKGKGGAVLMSNGDELQISRRKNFNFLKQIYLKNNFLMNN